MPKPLFQTLGILGMGLIGGSLALAAKKRGLVERVVSYNRNPEQTAYALKHGISDEAAESVEALAKASDCLVICTPVGVMADIFTRIAPHLKPGAVITDVGSTKQSIVEAAEQALKPEFFARFVGAHPIAGAEHSGVQAAKENLYEQRVTYLTPVAATDKEATSAIRALWEGCGARVDVLDAAEHDGIYAVMSHIPHLVCFAYAHMLDKQKVNLTQELRSFLRIAGSSPVMWRDILLANHKAIEAKIQPFSYQLHRLVHALLYNVSKLEHFLAPGREKLQKALPASASVVVEPAEALEYLPAMVASSCVYAAGDYLPYMGAGFNGVAAPLLTFPENSENLFKAEYVPVIHAAYTTLQQQLEAMIGDIRQGNSGALLEKLTYCQESYLRLVG